MIKPKTDESSDKHANKHTNIHNVNSVKKRKKQLANEQSSS